jgi:catechol 2,3-dioxygenase-like lactoylglutathione lyase family enzyme
MTTVNVRYMVDDVETAVAFYTTHLDFTVISTTLPAFADVARGDLRFVAERTDEFRRAARCRMAAARPRADGTVFI